VAWTRTWRGPSAYLDPCATWTARDVNGARGAVKLTVVHDGFESGSAVLESVSGGWPMVLSSLETLLETGDTRPAMGSGGDRAS
jgi:hypothetical protein